MKIEKAIEILQELNRHSSLAFSPGELEAVGLGIEALKWKQRFTAAMPPNPARLLPGED